MLDERWKLRAACRGMGPDIFFSDDRALMHKARSICVDCPVRLDCLDYAIRHRIPHGIWGALGEDRRRSIARAYRSGDPIAYRRALAESEDYLGRVVTGFRDDRPETPERRCLRCGALILEGTHPLDRNGPGAQCGKTSTYNKGCRCMKCLVAKAEYGERARNLD